MLHRFSPGSRFEALSWWAPKPYCAAHGPRTTRQRPNHDCAPHLIEGSQCTRRCATPPRCAPLCCCSNPSPFFFFGLFFFVFRLTRVEVVPDFQLPGFNWVECVQIPTASLSVSSFENRDSRNSGRRRSLLSARPTYASRMNLRSRASALRCAFCSFVNFSMVAYAASSVPSAWRRAYARL